MIICEEMAQIAISYPGNKISKKKVSTFSSLWEHSFLNVIDKIIQEMLNFCGLYKS